MAAGSPETELFLDRTVVAALRGFAHIATALVLLVAISVLAGYVLGVDALVTVAPGLRAMSILTAFSLILLAISVLADSIDTSSIATITTVSAMLIGLAVETSHALYGRDVIDPPLTGLLFGDTRQTSGSMSIATAAGILLSAMALWRRRKQFWFQSNVCAGLTLMISGLAILGYAYGVQDLYALSPFKTMALHTATGLFALSLAIIFGKPEVGWAAVVASSLAGGGPTRRQLLFILLPPVMGWLLLAATDARALGPGAAMAFLVVLTVVPLALLILRDGRVTDALDLERRATAALHASNQSDLENRLAAQAIELKNTNAAQAKAEADLAHAHRLDTLGQLTGGIAHDFNNILMAVIGSLDLIGSRLGPDHAVQRLVRNAMSAGERGAKLTGQLLAFSRTQRMNIRPTELDPVLTEAQKLLGTALGPTIEVSMLPGAPGLWASTDGDQLELSLLNMALNARDAMPDGGKLLITSGHTDDTLWIRVTDTGVGMTPDVAAKAIEPFFTTKEKGKGTGLGLAQVYGFARQCRGDLAISSAVGKGTTLLMTLPLSRTIETSTDRIAAQPIPLKTEADTRRKLILVIDDDRDVRTVLVEALQAAGYDVLEAGDGFDGLAHLETQVPDAAIVDFLMPGLNGAEVARRALIKQPDLPVIFVSGFSDTLALDGIPGAVVLRKPLALDALNRAVSDAVARKSLLSTNRWQAAPH